MHYNGRMAYCPPPILRGGIRLFGWSLDGVEVSFTTREGGVSGGPWASLNLDPRGGDDPRATAENQRRVLEALDLPGIFLPRQVHGTALIAAQEAPVGFAYGYEADAVMGDLTGAGLGVMTADCLPIMLHHPAAGVAAAVHAGWRGLVGGVIPRAVRALLERRGGEAREIRAFLGPCIGTCCYEVDPAVAEQIAVAAGSRAVIRGTSPRPMADLREAALLQLATAGLERERIQSVELCTSCRADLFYSYRRDGARTGRMAGVIALRATR